MNFDTTSGTLQFVNYTITFDAINIYPRSQEIGDISIQMINLLRTNPPEALRQLKVVAEKYPNDPILQGYLVNAYILQKDMDAAESLIIKNYQRFPNYFFARYAYIQLCLNNGELNKAEKIFDGKFDLSLVYPHRTVFHITEFLSFCKICAQYFYMLGDKEQATLFANMIKKIDNNHPFVKELEPWTRYCYAINTMK